MSAAAQRSSSLVHVTMPTDFSIICRSLLAHDPVYGPLMSATNRQPFDGLWTMRLSAVSPAKPWNGPAAVNSPSRLETAAGLRKHNS
jgi:hypothetical protein